MDTSRELATTFLEKKRPICLKLQYVEKYFGRQSVQMLCGKICYKKNLFQKFLQEWKLKFQLYDFVQRFK